MQHLLTINGGSSSLKFALFSAAASPQRLLSGIVERIGQQAAQFSVREAEGKKTDPQSIGRVDHVAAAGHVIDWLGRRFGLSGIQAIAHRVVHGGDKYSAAHAVDDALVAELERLASLVPQHLPAEISLIRAFREKFPTVRQIACFDTAFHHAMPRVAKLLAIPRRYEAAGVRRYGFHGLSFTYLMDELRRSAGDAAANGRVILAHLGAGASLAAVRNAKPLDTTMGFTATAGLVMATRTGDLDPGLVTWLMRHERAGADRIDEIVTRESGLVGVSETSSDMRDLLAREAGDPRAADAVALFCYQAKKWIGALAAALGGLDTLVFTAGIGENAAPVRARICEGLEFLGIRLDLARNAAGADVISAEGSPATVRVIRTDEELTMVRELQRVSANSP